MTPFLPPSASDAVAFLSGCVGKSLIVFALALPALALARRASASVRHLVCLLTLAALLALPPLSLLLPGRSLPVTVTIRDTHPTAPAPADIPAPAALTGADAAPRIAPTPLDARPFPWRESLLAVWTSGVLFLLLRLLLGLRALARLSRQSALVDDPVTLALADDCARALRLGRTPDLWLSPVRVPMTWGWRHPIVALPPASAAWPDDRRRAVLLHEMAHVQRRDWLWHRLADVAVALYWFHPLVWLMARRLRAESEAACDDLTLMGGVPAPDYARHLLEIAAPLRPRPMASPPAIGMAHTSDIKRRLTMILDPARPRRRTPRRILFVALGLSAAALVPLSMSRISATHAAPLDASAASSPPSASSDVPDSGSPANISAELVGVTDIKAAGSPWWDRSGAPLAHPLFDMTATRTSDDTAHLISSQGLDVKVNSVLIAFQLPPAAQGVTMRYDAPGNLGSTSEGQWPGKLHGQEHFTEAQINAQTGGMRAVEAFYPASQMRATVRVGLASGRWETAADFTPSAGGYLSPSHPKPITILSGPVAETKDGNIQETITIDTKDDVRLVAVDKQGRELLPSDIGDNSENTTAQITARFPLPLSQLKEIRVETRPFTWTEFKEVALRPQSPTPGSSLATPSLGRKG